MSIRILVCKTMEWNGLQQLESDGLELEVVCLYHRSSYHRWSNRWWKSKIHDRSQMGVHSCTIKVHTMSRPDSRSDPISESEPVSRCETIYWDSLPFCFFFFRAKLIPVGIQTIFVITKNHLHIQKNYHWSGVHQNLYTYTKSHLLIQTLIHIYV